MNRPYDEPELPHFTPPIAPILPDSDFGPETLIQHFAEDRARHAGAAAPPIYQTSTFVLPDAETFANLLSDPEGPHYVYTRSGNPTTSVLQAKLAKLEQGAWCYALGSGMAAITAALNACLHAGAHVVAVQCSYWPAQRYLRNYLPRFGVDTTFVNSVDPADFIAAVRPETRVLYLETPTSGSFEILDLEPLTAFARERGIVTITDNSWASPLYANPLVHGVDLVVHSATKHIGGHSDVVAGVVVGRDDRLRRRVYREVELIGGTLDPFAAWLLLRGLRTLPLRMRHMQDAAVRVAEFLANHPQVAEVVHPGLPGHPQHALARRYFRGWGSLFNFALRDASAENTKRFVDALRLFHIGVSWGGHESLALPGPYFANPRNPGWRVRMHCGLENADDLIADVERALQAI